MGVMGHAYKISFFQSELNMKPFKLMNKIQPEVRPDPENNAAILKIKRNSKRYSFRVIKKWKK